MYRYTSKFQPGDSQTLFEQPNIRIDLPAITLMQNPHDSARRNSNSTWNFHKPPGFRTTNTLSTNLSAYLTVANNKIRLYPLLHQTILQYSLNFSLISSLPSCFSKKVPRVLATVSDISSSDPTRFRWIDTTRVHSDGNGVLSLETARETGKRVSLAKEKRGRGGGWIINDASSRLRNTFVHQDRRRGGV